MRDRPSLLLISPRRSTMGRWFRLFLIIRKRLPPGSVVCPLLAPGNIFRPMHRYIINGCAYFLPSWAATGRFLAAWSLNLTISVWRLISRLREMPGGFSLPRLTPLATRAFRSQSPFRGGLRRNSFGVES